jgi:hypothetical protein
VEIYYTEAAGGIFSSIDEITGNLKDTLLSMAGAINFEDTGRDYFGDVECDYNMFGGVLQRENVQWGNATIVIQRDERLYYVIYYNAPVTIFSEYADYIFNNIIGSFIFTDDLKF